MTSFNRTPRTKDGTWYKNAKRTASVVKIVNSIDELRLQTHLYAISHLAMPTAWQIK
jgi:hypothetical protein